MKITIRKERKDHKDRTYHSDFSAYLCVLCDLSVLLIGGPMKMSLLPSGEILKAGGCEDFAPTEHFSWPPTPPFCAIQSR